MEATEILIHYRPLKRRYYILLTFSFYNFISGFLFNVWQPIMNSLKDTFHWNQAEINSLTNMFVVSFIVGVVPFIYAWNKFGIRFMYHLSILFLVVGTFLRLFVGSVKTLGILIQVSNVITGFGSILAATGSTVISALWFPNNERSRATSISLGFNSLGNALAPTIVTSMVPYFKHAEPTNSTRTMILNKEILQGIYQTIYLEAAMSLLVLIMILIYFPNCPPIAPSKSALPSLRIELIAGIKQLARNTNFWYVFVMTFALVGLSGGIGSLFTEFILPLGLTQTQCALLNTVMTICVSITIVIGGLIGDKISFKVIVSVSIPLTSAMYVVWGLQNLKLISYDIYSIYAVNIVAMSISALPTATLLEMACEAAFPVKEEVTTALMAFAFNLGTFVIITITYIPKFNLYWLPFIIAVIILLCYPLLYLYKELHKRNEIDQQVDGDDDQLIINSADIVQI